MIYGTPKKCPVCGDELVITQMRCGKCRTSISGEFKHCRFCQLDEKHSEFLIAFLRNRGSIKDVEKELGISYPSVRALLDSLLHELDLDKDNEKEIETQSSASQARMEILAQVADGRLPVDKASKLLRGNLNKEMT